MKKIIYLFVLLLAFSNSLIAADTLKLTFPNGGEEFIVGSDTLITWEGLPGNAELRLKYSYDGGLNWSEITSAASGMSYNWEKIPEPQSDQCLIKIIQNSSYKSDILTMSGHKKFIRTVAWSLDGTKIASGCGDKTIKIWNAADGAELRTIAGSSSINSLAWHKDGTKIVAGYADGTIKVWNISDGSEILSFSVAESVYSVSWSPDGTKIVSGSFASIKVWDASDGSELISLPDLVDAANSVEWNPDGTMLASGGTEGAICIWDAETGTELSMLTGHLGDVYDVSWSPDGTKIASCSFDKSVRIWDVSQEKELFMLNQHKNSVKCVSWSPDGSMLASGSYDKNIKIWNTSNGTLFRTLSGHSRIVTDLSWSPDGTKIVSGSYDRTLKIWDALNYVEAEDVSDLKFSVISPALKLIHPNGRENFVVGSDTLITWGGVEKDDILCIDYSLDLGNSWTSITNSASGFSYNWENIPAPASDECLIKVYQRDKPEPETMTMLGHKASIWETVWSPDGSKIISGSLDKDVKIWDAQSGDIIRTLSGHTKSVLCVALSSDGTKIASGGNDYYIKIWDASTGEEYLSIPGIESQVRDLCWSPDGNKIVTAFWNSDIVIWDAITGKLINTFEGSELINHSVDWSPDGTKIASGSADNRVIIWDASNGDSLFVYTGHGYSDVRCVEWSPDGTMIASCDNRDTVLVWDPATGETIHTLTGHSNSVISVAWSPDGTKIASSDGDKRIKIWDADSGYEIGTLLGHKGFVRTVDWSPDGTKIVSGSEDKTIKIWNIVGPLFQEDISDVEFSIVLPKWSINNVQMGEAALNAAKDSLVSEFVINSGAWKFRVDSIYIRGVDASAFSIIGGHAKYNLAPLSARFAAFRFVPTEDRIYQAEIVVITQADTLVSLISGEGIRPRISLITDLIDFGSIHLGKSKILRQIEVFSNIGSGSLTVSKISHNGSNVNDFTTLKGGGAFVLDVGETHKMDLCYAPGAEGLTSGTLEIYHNGDDSPAIIQLSGEGLPAEIISVALETLSLQAYPGDIVELPIILNNQKNIEFSGATHLATDLIFNPTLLYPYDYPIEKINESTAKITIDNLPVDKNIGEELAGIRFKVALGNAEICDLTLSNAEAIGGTANIDVVNGTFTLLGICREGGDRLIKPVPQAGIKSISPNPAENKLNIEFTINETGYTEISIYNILGEKVKTLFSENISEPGDESISADIKELGSGQYLLIFKTAAFLQSTTVIILK